MQDHGEGVRALHGDRPPRAVDPTRAVEEVGEQSQREALPGGIATQREGRDLQGHAMRLSCWHHFQHVGSGGCHLQDGVWCLAGVGEAG